MATKQINWNCTKGEVDRITKIMLRAASLMSFEQRYAQKQGNDWETSMAWLNKQVKEGKLKPDSTR
jgi:hypothetical protein